MRRIPHLIKLILVLIVINLIAGCKKNDDGEEGAPADLVDPACTPYGETTTLAGNEATWQYQYDNKGMVSKIVKLNRYAQQEYIIEVSSDRVVRTSPTAVVKTVYNANIYEALPSQALVSLTINGGVEQKNYYTYDLTYDNKKRLSKIVEHTPTVFTDREWQLVITYNDKDNVVRLQYSWTTHPAETISPIAVTAYDDKPSPFAATKYWKFLMNNFAWDNYDPEPILTVLSRNNPLDYVMNEGHPAQLKRTMTYTYNSQGFPVERMNTNKNANGESSFKQTFTYQCK